MFKPLRALLSLCLFLVAAGPALAADIPFDASKFNALQKEGKPVLVNVHAEWCSTCKAQERVVSELLKTPQLNGITSFRVDFDGQKDIVKRFKVQYQSTLIVFKAGKEVGRSVGDTSKETIADLLKKAI